ncbi:CAP domain-containing protein [Phenylobacterium sp.]|uniref:CAP domain-containing protein n=1 Tax=Phenylobacterium sp. TaxID=1871053 RepID=UPI0035B12547
MKPSRRVIVAGGLAAAAGPALAAPRAAGAWIAYEARLRARLTDAGGGRFDPGLARGLLDLTNGARRAAGAAPVAWHPALAETARAHAADLAQRDYVEHLTPEGFDPTDRLGLLGRRLIGSAAENIAYRRGGPPHTAGDLMATWRRSRPHWINLLREHHTHVGYGVARLGERSYAVGLYAAPDGELAADLPFQPRSPAPLMAAMQGLGDRYMGVWLDDELNDGRRVAVDAGPLPRGVYRLRIDKRMGGSLYTSLFGPIIAWSGAA